jgi:hypothetical protein
VHGASPLQVRSCTPRLNSRFCTPSAPSLSSRSTLNLKGYDSRYLISGAQWVHLCPSLTSRTIRDSERFASFRRTIHTGTLRRRHRIHHLVSISSPIHVALGAFAPRMSPGESPDLALEDGEVFAAGEARVAKGLRSCA